MKVDLLWDERYSNTLEDDKFGRWARIAYAGRGGMRDGRVSNFELAWISKIKSDNGEVRYDIRPSFPFKGKTLHLTIEDAKQEVEDALSFFLDEMNLVTK